MPEASEKRVKILSEPESNASGRPVRGGTSEYLKNSSGFTTYRAEREDGTVQPCNIIFPQSAYEVVMQHLSEDVSREHGGFLLGHELHCGAAETPTVIVDCAIPAKHTEGTPVRLTFTEDTWRALDEITDKLRETGRPIERVGWYHSHPNIAIFLSHYDLDVCTIFDRRRYPIALVVDPVKQRAGFFVRGKNGYGPQSAQGFMEAHDLRPESVVKWTNMTRTTPAVPETNKSVSPETNRSVLAGAFPRTPLKIDKRPTRGERLRASAFRIAAAVLFFVMLGALYALFDKQERLEQQVHDLSAALAKVPPRIPSSTSETPGGDTSANVDGTATTDTTSGTSGSTKSSGGRPLIPAKKSATPVANTGMSIDPLDATVEENGSKTFTVRGRGRKLVHWSIDPPYEGSIDQQTGKYKAPSKISSRIDVRVIATLGDSSLRPAVIHLSPPKEPPTKSSSDSRAGANGGNGGNTVTHGQDKSSHDKGDPQGTSGQNSSGQASLGQSPSGQSTSDQKATGQNSTGQNTADQKATGQNAAQNTSAQGTSGQTTSGQGTSGQMTDKEAQANQGTNSAPPQTGANPKVSGQHGSGSETSRPEPSPSPTPPKP